MNPYDWQIFHRNWIIYTFKSSPVEDKDIEIWSTFDVSINNLINKIWTS